MTPVAWIMLAGIIISAVTSIWSQSSANNLNRQENELNRDYNTDAAATAYERGIEQWNRETDYGLQMSKLESAGINPALAYAQGVSIPSLPSVDPAQGISSLRQNPVDFSSIANGVQSFANFQLQKQMADSESNLKDSMAKYYDEKGDREERSLNSTIRLNEANISHLNALVDYLGECKQTMHEDGELKKMMSQLYEQEFNKNQAAMGALVQEIKDRARITNVQANRMYSLMTEQINYYRACAQEAAARAGLHSEQGKYYAALVNYYDNAKTQLDNAQRDYYKALERNVDAHTDVVEIETWFKGMDAVGNLILNGAKAYGEIASRGMIPDIIIPYTNNTNFTVPYTGQ